MGRGLWKEFNTYQSFRFVIQSYRDLEFCKLIYMVSLSFRNRDAYSFEVILAILVCGQVNDAATTSTVNQVSNCLAA